MLAMDRGSAGERYIIGGTNLSYQQFFALLREVSGIKGKAIAVPKPLAFLAGYLNSLGERLTGREPFFTHKEAGQIYYNKVFSIAKAASELGYEPMPFAVALSDTIDFLMKA
jgi:nucleoside-diphosphate-sugar epimerase